MLNAIWYVLLAVLFAAYAVLDGFDLGVGILYPFVARTESDRRILLRSIGPFWDGNEVWLLTGGGAIFAAFPLVYATVFSGFYLAMMLVLLALILRACAIEFRSKVESEKWRALWDRLFFYGSLLASLLFGVAVGNLMRGIPIDGAHTFTGSFFGLLNPFSILMGLLAVVMFAMQGASYLVVKTEGELQERAAGWAVEVWMAFILLFCGASVWTFFEAPYLFARHRHAVWPWAAVLLVVVAAGAMPLLLQRGRAFLSFLASSATIVGLIAILAIGAFPLLAPSRTNLDFSLTAYNASSTAYTLRWMLILALIGVPIVLAYTAYIYTVFKGKVRLEGEGY
jgi:cytochrome bd ubiquinol oxidase subunit II